jgi:hypothetical protein
MNAEERRDKNKSTERDTEKQEIYWMNKIMNDYSLEIKCEHVLKVTNRW